MLKFYYRNSDNFTEKTQGKLEEMVVAHKVIQVNGDDISLPDSVTKNDLPVLFDGHETFSSPEKIEQFLDELHKELKTGRGMQSDACHLDPDNPEECL